MHFEARNSAFICSAISGRRRCRYQCTVLFERTVLYFEQALSFLTKVIITVDFRINVLVLSSAADTLGDIMHLFRFEFLPEVDGFFATI
jgi:hypothetical protein